MNGRMNVLRGWPGKCIYLVCIWFVFGEMVEYNDCVLLT